MRVAIFSARSYDRQYLGTANRDRHELFFLDARLTKETAALAANCTAVCPFVNDDLSAPVLDILHRLGVELVALRSAGFNHVDVRRAAELGIRVARVPAYSPYAVAEHAVGLILTLNRRFHRAFNRVREGNFALDGLVGFDIHGRTVGVVGTGEIGSVFARIMIGFGARVVAFDPKPSQPCRDLGVEYVPFEQLLAGSDIISLHCPLTPETHHLIDADAIRRTRRGVMLINTSRGALVDTLAVIQAMKSGHIGYLGLDVYEEEAGLFFEDLSGQVLQDDVFVRLLTFPNVLITSHQGFFTDDALHNIAETTIANISAHESRIGTIHLVPTY